MPAEMNSAGWGDTMMMQDQKEAGSQMQSGKQQEQVTADSSTTDNTIPLPMSAEAEIATGLKHLYGQMLAEPMPDKFAGLLAQLADLHAKPEQKT